MSCRLLRQYVHLRVRTRPCVPCPVPLSRRPGYSLPIRHCSATVSRRQENRPASVTPADISTSHDVLHDSGNNVAAILKACPGCGALAQTIETGQPGFYSTKRNAVRSYLKSQSSGQAKDGKTTEDELVAKALDNVDPELLKSLDLCDDPPPGKAQGTSTELPLCDRCHDLTHHHTGVSIAHPSVESIHDTIAESPYKYNHIYHVLDAADFPLSLLPNIHRALDAAFQRSRNRRSKTAGYSHGKKTEISFIITRSDLLAPKKSQVDGMMQYIVSVLRDALGTAGWDVRLGNVRCVSAKRGWWTRELKADIWKRGAGGWMVGKVNVGKSNLFEAVFPKGQAENINFDGLRSKSRLPASASTDHGEVEEPFIKTRSDDLLLEDGNILLPPARQEAPYPMMPTISALPGTTASPIRIPFGNGRGELVDLPGLARGELEQFVRPEHRADLIMKARITPEQHVIKPGKSLLLGGLIRITPVQDDTIILAYPFTPIKPHLTATDKAVVLEGEGKPESSGVPFIAGDNARGVMKSAGRFKIKWDVTKQRAGPLTSRSAVGLKARQLSFVVLSADILVEGVGWIELVAQVRKKWGLDEPTHIPEVEVFSPEGKYVGVRQPMNAWVLGGLNTRPAVMQRKKRPRRALASAR